MGIQDRDYWHDRQREREGLPPRRPNFQKSATGEYQAVPKRRFRVIDKVRPKAKSFERMQPVYQPGGSYSVAFALIAVLVTVLGYLGYKVFVNFF